MTKPGYAAIICVVTAFVGLAAGRSAAQGHASVRVVNGAQILSRPSADANVVSTAEVGTVLDVLEGDDLWYWVLLPTDANGRRARGWVRTNDVEVTGGEANQPTGHPGARPSSSFIPPTAEDLRTAQTRREREDRQRAIDEQRIEKARLELEQRQEEYEAAVQGRQPSGSVTAKPISFSRPDLFGGYAALWNQSNGTGFPLGWIASIGGHLNESLGIAGEVSGSYRRESVLGVQVVSTSIHTFAAGPRLSRPRGPGDVFAQILGGMEMASSSAFGSSVSTSRGFALLPGAGLDLPVTRAFGVRVGGELKLVHNSLEWSSGFRLLGGLVVPGRRQ